MAETPIYAQAIMHGWKAFLIFVGFLAVALILFAGVMSAWKIWRREKQGGAMEWGGVMKLAALSAFLVLWFVMVSSSYVRKAVFLRELRELDSGDIYAIEIGRHEFREQQQISDIVAALRGSQWFEVNHGGWGDSVRLTIRRHTGKDVVLEVAQYFREPAAVLSPAHTERGGYVSAEALAADLPDVLRKYLVELPNCDTTHGRPCTPEQLNP